MCAPRLYIEHSPDPGDTVNDAKRPAALMQRSGSAYISCRGCLFLADTSSSTSYVGKDWGREGGGTKRRRRARLFFFVCVCVRIMKARWVVTTEEITSNEGASSCVRALRFVCVCVFTSCYWVRHCCARSSSIVNAQGEGEERKAKVSSLVAAALREGGGWGEA